MAKSNILALDKTGTITEGKPSVVDVKMYETFDPSLLLALVNSSNHPISKGIKSYLEETYDSLTSYSLNSIKTIEAKGISAHYQNKKLLGGNSLLLEENGLLIDSDSENTLFLFAIDDVLVARFELTDTIRKGAVEAIKNIQNLGIEVVMLTGDHKQSAMKVAKQVGISHVQAELLPQDKSNFIEMYHQKGDIVVMVGDGINDAIALASSDIAIAMGNGADVAIDVSDVVLLDEKPESIYKAYKISHRTFRAVKENLGFSLLYNVIAVPLAVLGYVNPLIAALSMSLSSLVVVSNSLRIKHLKLKDT